MMENREQLIKLAQAIKALRRSTERAIHTGTTEGIGTMAVNSFSRLQGHATTLLPDDFYLTEVLLVEVDPAASDEEKIVQVSFAADQMYTYLRDMVEPKERRKRHRRGGRGPRRHGGFPQPPEPPVPPEFEMFIEATRSTLRRALSSLEIEFSPGTTISNIVETGANLTQRDYSQLVVKNCVFTNSNFTGTRFADTTLENVVLDGSNLTSTTLDEATLAQTTMRQANLTGASLVGARLTACSLEQANLTDADLRGAQFEECNLTGATLPDGTLYERGMDLTPYTG